MSAVIGKPSRLVPLAMAGAAWLSVACALVAQHGFDMRPCPWCILQRAIFVVIGFVCLATAFVPWRRVRISLNLVTVLLAGGGVIAAVYQHEVAAKSFSCNITFADKLITAIGLDSLWPWMFRVTASCAEAAVSVLGVPFEYWSLALFALLALVAAGLMLRAVRVEA
jgi:protein dithiol:quinone oxidoreductase